MHETFKPEIFYAFFLKILPVFQERVCKKSRVFVGVLLREGKVCEDASFFASAGECLAPAAMLVRQLVPWRGNL